MVISGSTGDVAVNFEEQLDWLEKAGRICRKASRLCGSAHASAKYVEGCMVRFEVTGAIVSLLDQSRT